MIDELLEHPKTVITFVVCFGVLGIMFLHLRDIKKRPYDHDVDFGKELRGEE